MLWQSTLQMQGADEQPLSFVISKRQLPNSVPDDWNVTELSDGQVQVVCSTFNNDASRVAPLESHQRWPATQRI